MKAKVKLSYSVELIVDGKDEDAISNWIWDTTPSEAMELALANNKFPYEEYAEEIIYTDEYETIDDEVDVVIKEEDE